MVDIMQRISEKNFQRHLNKLIGKEKKLKIGFYDIQTQEKQPWQTDDQRLDRKKI
jgi:hypothetical protein